MSGAETGWVIEKSASDCSSLWWNGRNWTTVATSAIRYARQRDAERVILLSGLEGAVAAEYPQSSPVAPPEKSWRAG